MDRERRRESRVEARRPTEGGMKKATVGGESSRVPGVIRRKKYRLDLALTTSGMGGTGFLNRHAGNVPGQHGPGHLPGDKAHIRDLHRESAGYRIVATDAPSQHHGGVALFYRPSPLFEVEAVQEYGPNILSFEVATGSRR